VAGFLALLCSYILIKGWARKEWKYGLGAGAALGVGFTIRYELLACFTAIAVLWLVLAWRKKTPLAPLAGFAAAFAVPASLVPLYNWWARGSAGDFAYNSLPFFVNLIKARFVPIAKDGIPLAVVRYVWIYFLSPNLHNVVIYCPFALIGGAGVVVLTRTFGARILFLVVPGFALAAAILAMTYSTWAWGLRYAYIFWLLLGVAGLLVPRRRRWLRVVYAACVAWGVALSLSAVMADYQMTENDMAAEILGDPGQVNYRGWLPEGRINPRYSQILWQFKYAGLAAARTVDYYVHDGRILWFDLPPTAGNDVERAVLSIWPVAAHTTRFVSGWIIWPGYLLFVAGTAAAALRLRGLLRREPVDLYWRGETAGL
jgi:hypothetical protein